MVKWLKFSYAAILLFLLFLPTLRWVSLQDVDGFLYGYADKISERPAGAINGFFDKELQKWAEGYFNVHLGFREKLIRSFNEINFMLFREAPRLSLYSTSENGLYSKMSIDNLNYEIVNRKELELRYRSEADKLLILQRALEQQGKYFVVIIASSKPYVYPQSLGNRYLIGGAVDIFNRAARYGAVLEDVGVNVIDAGPLLREFVERTGIDTHPDSGVHWNYYAGCLVARRLVDGIRSRYPGMPALTCGDPEFADPHMVDVDGLKLLNIWTDGNLSRPTPYPSIVAAEQSSWLPSIVFIGDSFADQILYALQQARIYARIVTSNYFRVRGVTIGGGQIKSTHGQETEEVAVRNIFTEDIAASDVVVLQMVDYNVFRWGYGVADYLLGRPEFNSYRQAGSVSESEASSQGSLKK